MKRELPVALKRGRGFYMVSRLNVECAELQRYEESKADRGGRTQWERGDNREGAGRNPTCGLTA